MILFITDSLGGTRDFPEKLSYQNTWVHKVKEAFARKGISSHSIVLYGLDSQRLSKELFETHVQLYNPSIVIYQLGIVDCAPRSISSKELGYLDKMPLVIRNLIKKVIKNNYATISEARNIANIDLASFEENVNFLSSNYPSIFIPIAPVCTGYEQKSPLIKTYANKYNQVLKKYSKVWLDKFEKPSNDIIENMFTKDFYHMNKLGHQYLSECILDHQIIANLMNEVVK